MSRRRSSLRFCVYRFPSLYGTPIFTNSFVLAFLISILRAIKHWGLDEIRIIDSKTQKHIVVCK